MRQENQTKTARGDYLWRIKVKTTYRLKREARKAESSKPSKKAVGLDRPKRGHYKKQECPYCHKHFGNLENHIKLKHPLESPPAELTKEDLINPRPVKEKVVESVRYVCVDCHAELRKAGKL